MNDLNLNKHCEKYTKSLSNYYIVNAKVVTNMLKTDWKMLKQ